VEQPQDASAVSSKKRPQPKQKNKKRQKKQKTQQQPQDADNKINDIGNRDEDDTKPAGVATADWRAYVQKR
jgi:hypothetical protein